MKMPFRSRGHPVEHVLCMPTRCQHFTSVTGFAASGRAPQVAAAPCAEAVGKATGVGRTRLAFFKPQILNL